MKRVVIALAVLLVLGYGLFEARRLIQGPEVIIEAPLDGSATSTTLVTVVGRVKNISFLTINDKPAFANEAGQFVYRYSPPLGYTALTVGAEDRFGRRVVKTVRFTVLNYCPAKS